MMKKLLCLCLLLCALVSGVVFRHTLLGWLVAWRLEAVVSHHFGAPFKAEKITVQHGQLCLEGVTLARPDGEVKLTLEHAVAAFTFDIWHWQLQAHLELDRPVLSLDCSEQAAKGRSSLSWIEVVTSWTIHDGTLHLVERMGGKECALTLSGNMHSDPLRHKYRVEAQIVSAEGQAEIKAVWHQQGDLYQVEAECAKLHATQVRLLQRLLGFDTGMEWRDGLVDAQCVFKFKEQQLITLEVERLIAQHVNFAWKQYAIEASAAEIKGAAHFVASGKPLWSGLDTSLSISDGAVHVLNESGLPLQLRDINAEIELAKGIAQKSVIRATYAGLEGNIYLDLFSPDEALKVVVAGSTQNFSMPLFPCLERGVRAAFPDSELRLVAMVKRLSAQGFGVEGELLLQSPTYDAPFTLPFGANFERVSPKIWLDWSTCAEESQAWLKLSADALEQLSPAATAGVANLIKRKMQYESGFQDFLIRDGWFAGRNLPAELFLSSFLFQEIPLAVKGMGGVVGKFRDGVLTVHYGGAHTELVSPYFSIEVPRIEGPALAPLAQNWRDAGVHYFDFVRREHFGFLPIRDGRYVDKTMGLEFGDVSATVYLEGYNAHILDATCQADGMHFKGSSSISYDGHGKVKLSVQTEEAMGSVTALQRFLSHFGESDFWQLPAQGDLVSGPDGVVLNCLFENGVPTLQCQLHGRLENLNPGVDWLGMHFAELSTDFAYDHHTRILHFQNVEGALGVESGGAATRYRLQAPSIALIGLRSPTVLFDVSMLDGVYPLARLAGEMGVSDQTEQAIAVVLDNQLSHIAGMPFNLKSCLLRDWSHLSHFEAAPVLALSRSFPSLRLLCEKAWQIHLPSHLERLFSVEEDSFLYTSLIYDEDPGKWLFKAFAERFEMGPIELRQLLLEGMIGAQAIELQKVQWEGYQGSLSLACEEGNVRVKQLHLRQPSGNALTLNGVFDLAQHSFSGEVEALDMRLQQLPGELAVPVELSVHGQGSFEILFVGRKPWAQITAFLDAQVEPFHLENLSIENRRKFHCFYSSETGFQLKQLALTVSDPAAAEPSVLQARCLSYDAHRRTWYIEGCKFQTLPQAMPALLKPFGLGEQAQLCMQLLQTLKPEGAISGEIDLTIMPEAISTQVRLQDDTYHLAGCALPLKAVRLDYFPPEMRLSGVWDNQQKQYPFVLSTQFKGNAADMAGKAVLKESDSSGQLQLSWHKAQDQLMITAIEGELSGVRAHLTHLPESSSAEYVALAGSVAIDFTQAKALFPPHIAQTISKLKIGNGYQLSGTVLIPCDSLAKPIVIDGILSGVDFQFLGFNIQAIQASVHSTGGTTLIENLTVNDPALALHLPQLVIKKEPDADWTIAIPYLEIKELRPRLLKRKDGKPFTQQRLLVDHAVMRGVSMHLLDTSDWHGNGSIHFSSEAKVPLEGTIFAIPREFVLRLGMDSNLFIPVMGEIQFRLGDGKFFLTSFRKVYSQEKRSQFRLVEDDQNPSYIAANGEIQIKVDVKQNHLLFKFTEFMTLSINGTLGRPHYQLRRTRLTSWWDTEEVEASAEEDH